LFAQHKPGVSLVTMEALIAPPVIRAALSAGCHVLAEKPSCVRLADFEALVRQAEQAKRSLVLALANRVDPVIVETRRIVQSGEIGKLYGMDLQIVADQTRLTSPAYHKTWVAQKARAGGGHLIWLGIHWLDLAMYISGSRIRDVAALTANVGGQPIDTEDSAVVDEVVWFGVGNVQAALLQPESRACFRRLLDQGWIDAVRTRHPSEPVYTFWDYKRDRWRRDAGLRIDFLLLNRAAAERLIDAGVDRSVRGEEGASDHAPVWVSLRH
jgi:hypothetical protein